MFRYFTAGESHGPQLTAIIEGLPSGVSLREEQINIDLARRMEGYGRGDRMKIEKDTVRILSGVRWGETLGSPVTLVVQNRDWPNWDEKMSVRPEFRDESIAVTRPRPGHADLSGAMKYHHRDVRNILERSSARETAARVAVGGVAKAFLAEFGIEVAGVVAAIGWIESRREDLTFAELKKRAAASEVSTWDTDAELEMKRAIDAAQSAGDTLGGIIEIHVSNVPPGLGSYAQWDRKLDGRLAGALMSIQAIKGVECGIGFEASRRPGSKVHDEIFYDSERATDNFSGFYRQSNNAGGLEGGMSNGEEIVVRAAMKPIPTLYTPLRSVDIGTKEPFEAAVERSDTCAVPAAAVVAEAVVATVIANVFLEKFGGDSLAEIRRNYDGYCAWLKEF